MTAKFTTATAVSQSAAFDPDTPAPPRYRTGPPFDALDIRPGRVLLIGAPPAAGKTALALQVVSGVLHHQPEVRALFGCVEMAPADLLARVIARLSGVAVDHITDKTYTAGEKVRVAKALELHRATLDRMAFLDPPFTMQHLAEAATEFGATTLAVDYLQRFGHGKDLRESLDGVMTGVRRLALAGAAVIAVSSVARQKDDKGRSAYSGLGMASYRGSAELEFGCDSGYLLDAAEGIAVLRCVKNRFGRPADIHLRFDGAYQRFDPGDALDGFDAAPGKAPRKGKAE
jgi:replicative DNA helicase